MFTIGLTGGIGTGKSSVARFLSALGAELIDADRVGWQVYTAGSPGFHAVVAEFGREIVGDDGEIDRKRLGRLVFGDPARMAALTAIVWPLIAREVGAQIDEAAERGAATMVVEAAVLFEARWEHLFDEVWAVTAQPETILGRLKERDGVAEADVRDRVAAQLSDDERARRADVVIANDGSMAELRSTVQSVWHERTRGKA